MVQRQRAIVEDATCKLEAEAMNTRSELLPLIAKPGAADPSMVTFFPSVNVPEDKVIV
jgi:hypothetical protein